MVKSNIDPIEERKQGRVKVNTFGEMATEVMEAKFKEFRNEKHKSQWEQTISFYAKPLLKKVVSEIDTADILKVLKPIWDTKPETASRLRGRIETILNAAKAKGMRFGENPALWKGHLDNLLPKRQRLTRGHFAALPYQEISKLIETIRKSGSISTFALEFTILTAARSGEIRGATWGEIDFEKAAWVIPAERMKAGKEHRVPLTARAIESLEKMKPLARGKTSFVFPSRKEGKPLSDMTLAESLKHFNKEVTVHGFRSAFRDWCGEETHYPRELAEAALAHSIGNAVEQAYRRGDALKKRRELMKDWEKHCVNF
jgi:integrase